MTTNQGLFRFDGTRFVAFTMSTVAAFHSDAFHSVNVTSTGDLWVGSRDVWTYRYRDGEWTAYSVAEVLDWVQGFVEDGEGTVWAYGSNEAVAHFDGSRWVPIEQRIRQGWTQFVADANGTIWTYIAPSDAPGIPTSPFYADWEFEGVVARWDGVQFTPPQDWRLFGFASTQYGPLFHHPADGAPVPASLEEARGLRVQLTDAAGTPKGTFVIEDVLRWARLVDRAGRVWTQRVGYDGSLTVLDGDTEVARILPEGSRWIERVFEDRQGNVWVISDSGGLLQVTPEPFRRFGPEEGAPLVAESAVATADGTILVSSRGLPDAPLFAVRDGAWTSRVVDPGAAAARPYPPADPSNVGLVVEDGRGRRFGTYLSRLVQIRDDTVARVWANPSGEYLYLALADASEQDVLWVGDGAGVLRRFDTDAFAVTDSFQVPVPSSGYRHPTDVHRASDGQLWVASRGGLAVVREDGQPHPVDALAGVPVQDLADAPDGSLWATTETRGLIRIREGQVDEIGLEDGLPTSHLVGLLFDDSGYVWLIGRTLLYRVRVTDVERAFEGSASGPIDVVSLAPSAGYLGSSDRFEQAATAPDGSLWLPSHRGVTRIDPEAYAHQFSEPPPVHIEAIRTPSGESALPAASVRLPRGARAPEVDYTAIDLTAPDLVRFRTRLDGYDDEWQDQGTARSVPYRGLGPGTYTFEVQARNGGGIWSAPAAATLVVPPYVYETWWFRGLCGLGLLGALVLGVRVRERAQKDRRRQLETLVEERTRQLRTEKETVAAQAQRLNTLDRAKSAFFANVSHEFRTPLTLTLGPLDDVLAGEQGEISDTASASLSMARRNAGRVLDLINQMLDVARLEAGQTPLQARPLDLGAVARSQTDAFAALAAQKDIEVQVPQMSAEVYADPEHLSTILSNLLSNAFKFTPEQGTVRVGVESDATSARVVIRDSGPGIPAADLPHVFDRFYQVRSDRAQRPLGTGIGLALAHELATLHGGSLVAESEEGFGSTFTLALPLGREHLAPEQIVEEPTGDETETPRPALPTPHRQLEEAPRVAEPPDEDAADDVPTILVVEDNADIRTLVRTHLERAGYRVVEAPDGEAGLETARQLVPDLILSDVMMPKMDGLAFCRAIKTDPSTDFIPVILLTAKAAQEDKLEGFREHADAYLVKPFGPAELLARIEALIAVRTRLRERFRREGTGLDDGPATNALHARTVEVTAAETVFLEQVRETIEAQLDDPAFTVQGLAEAVGMSRGHLHRQLVALTGQSPSETTRTMRLERATQLLAAGAGTVSEVAYATGFKSVSHFSTLFTAFADCPPSMYRDREA